MNWNHAFGYFSLHSSSSPSMILVFSLMNCTEVWRWRVRLASAPWSLSYPCHEPPWWRTVRGSRCTDWPPRRKLNYWRTRKWQVGVSLLLLLKWITKNERENNHQYKIEITLLSPSSRLLLAFKKTEQKRMRNCCKFHFHKFSYE